MNLLQTLRAKTGSQHEDLHTHPVLVDLAEPQLTLPFYLRALEKFYGFYAPLEKSYAESRSPHLQRFAAGIMTDHLKRDLARHGINTDDLPVMEYDRTFSPAEILGYLYLREGSNLGGRLISKNLLARLGLEPGIDNLFFWGHGEETASQWKSLQSVLNGIDDEESKADIAAAASHFFTLLSDWLSLQSREAALA